MVLDLRLGSDCDHRVVDEVLVLQGISPNFFCDLAYPCNLNKDSMIIREYNATENKVDFNPDVDGLTDYVIDSVGKQRIYFNQLFYTPGVNFVDGTTTLIPLREYLATYIVESEEFCPKDCGSKKQNDISFDEIGRLKDVESLPRVKQAVIKALLTTRGNNPDQPDYGSTLYDSVGKELLPLSYLRIQQTIQDTVARLIESQSENADISPDDEVILGLDDMQITETDTDPRKVLIKLVILVGTYEKVPIEFNVDLGKGS